MKIRLLILAALASLAVIAVGQGVVPNTATVSWVAPTLNTDGSTITGSLTYNLYQGATGSESLVQSGITVTSFVISSGLSSGSTVCWQVTAVESGQEGARSSEACKSFAPAVPTAPTSVQVR